MGIGWWCLISEWIMPATPWYLGSLLYKIINVIVLPICGQLLMVKCVFHSGYQDCLHLFAFSLSRHMIGLHFSISFDIGIHIWLALVNEMWVKVLCVISRQRLVCVSMIFHTLLACLDHQWNVDEASTNLSSPVTMISRDYCCQYYTHSMSKKETWL